MFKDVALKPKTGSIDHARKLRRDMTLPERLLWRELRKRPGGLKFRRQHPSGAYVLDFYCGDARLAIEVDGMAHHMGDNPARDAARNRWFARAGIKTLRIPARIILGDLDAAVVWIVTEAKA